MKRRSKHRAIAAVLGMVALAALLLPSDDDDGRGTGVLTVLESPDRRIRLELGRRKRIRYRLRSKFDRPVRVHLQPSCPVDPWKVDKAMLEAGEELAVEVLVRASENRKEHRGTCRVLVDGLRGPLLSYAVVVDHPLSLACAPDELRLLSGTVAQEWTTVALDTVVRGLRGAEQIRGVSIVSESDTVRAKQVGPDPVWTWTSESAFRATVELGLVAMTEAASSHIWLIVDLAEGPSLRHKIPVTVL